MAVPAPLQGCWRTRTCRPQSSPTSWSRSLSR